MTVSPSNSISQNRTQLIHPNNSNSSSSFHSPVTRLDEKLINDPFHEIALCPCLDKTSRQLFARHEKFPPSADNNRGGLLSAFPPPPLPPPTRPSGSYRGISPYTRNISNNLASDETRARPFQPSTTSNLLRLLMTFSNLDPSRAKCPPERNRDRVSNWKLEWWKRTDGEMDGWTGDDWWGRVL